MDDLITAERLSVLIGEIYDSAIDPLRWTATIDAIRQELGFATASLDLIALPAVESLVNVSANIPEPYAATLVDYTPQLSELWGGVDKVMKLPLDEPAVLTRVRPDRAALFRHPIYVEWATPQGLSDMMALWLARDSDTVGSMAFGWAAAAGSIGDREVRIARMLVPHAQRAATINRLLDLAALRDATFGALFDTLDAPVLVVGADLKIVHANRAGRMLIGRGGALRLRGGTLTTTDRGTHHALDAAIRDATGDITALGRKGFGIPLKDVDGDVGALHVLPLRPDHPGGRRHAAIFVARACAAPSPAKSVVEALFGLTPAETAVFQQVAGGHDVPRAAARLGIAPSTVRTHLLRVYDKTGVRRQADLVRLSTSLAMPVSCT
ncbi:MAG TPA: helix-turn-helix transcriptional regulator [Allosphingosinicella sp.]|jgi:DNA-binding CsgD family transcriptional regulator